MREVAFRPRCGPNVNSHTTLEDLIKAGLSEESGKELLAFRDKLQQQHEAKEKHNGSA